MTDGVGVQGERRGGVSTSTPHHGRIGVSSSHSGEPKECQRLERNTVADVVTCDAHIDDDCGSVPSEPELQAEANNAGEREDASTQATLRGIAAASRFCRLLVRVAATDECGGGFEASLAPPEASSSEGCFLEAARGLLAFSLAAS